MASSVPDILPKMIWVTIIESTPFTSDITKALVRYIWCLCLCLFLCLYNKANAKMSTTIVSGNKTHFKYGNQSIISWIFSCDP